AAELHVFGNNGDAPELTPDVAVDHVEFTGSISTGDKLLEVFAENVKVDAGVTLDTGEDDILFRARRIGTAELENLTPIAAGDAFTQTVSIDVGTGATLQGGGIFLLATAEDREFSEIIGASKLASNFVIDPLKDKVAELTALPVKVLLKESTATITLHDGAKLLGEGTVEVEATAKSVSEGNAISTLFSIGFTQAKATATVDVQKDVEIEAA